MRKNKTNNLIKSIINYEPYIKALELLIDYYSIRIEFLKSNKPSRFQKDKLVAYNKELEKLQKKSFRILQRLYTNNK